MSLFAQGGIQHVHMACPFWGFFLFLSSPPMTFFIFPFLPSFLKHGSHFLYFTLSA